MARIRERACAWVISVLVCSSSVTHAQQPSDNDVTFKRGLDQYSHANYTGAVATWENLLGSLGEERGYKILHNLGLAYEKLGDVTRAVERHTAFVKHVEQNPALDTGPLHARVEDSRAHLKKLRSTHGAIEVKAPTGSMIVMTKVGTAEPRAAGYVVWLDPGTHSVELYVGTDQSRVVTVEVKADQTIPVEVSAPTPVVVAPPPPPPRPPEHHTSPWVFVGAGVTVASLALPITLFVVANGKRDDATVFGTGQREYATAQSSFESARTAYLISWLLPVALGAATGIGFYLDRRSADVRVAVGPMAITLDGRF